MFHSEDSVCGTDTIINPSSVSCVAQKTGFCVLEDSFRIIKIDAKSVFLYLNHLIKIIFSRFSHIIDIHIVNALRYWFTFAHIKVVEILTVSVE